MNSDKVAPLSASPLSASPPFSHWQSDLDNNDRLQNDVHVYIASDSNESLVPGKRLPSLSGTFSFECPNCVYSSQERSSKQNGMHASSSTGSSTFFLSSEF